MWRSAAGEQLAGAHAAGERLEIYEIEHKKGGTQTNTVQGNNNKKKTIQISISVCAVGTLQPAPSAAADVQHLNQANIILVIICKRLSRSKHKHKLKHTRCLFAESIEPS